MAGLQRDGLVLSVLSTSPLADVLENEHVIIYALNDGSIRVVTSTGEDFRLDNKDLDVVVHSISASFASQINSISGALVDDSTLVHKTGVETIGGAKTFTSTVSITGDNSPLLQLVNTDGISWAAVLRRTDIGPSFDVKLLNDFGSLYVKSTGIVVTTDTETIFKADAAELKYYTNTIWHAGNDGAGSGLDADTLDGLHGSAYASQANLTNLQNFNVSVSNVTANQANLLSQHQLFNVGVAGITASNATRLNALENSDSSQNNAISSHQLFNTQVASVTAAIVQKNIDQDNAIADLQAYDTTFSGAVSNLSSRVTNTENNIDAHQVFNTQVATLSASQNLSILSLQQFNSQVAGVTASNTTKINSIDAAITAHQIFNNQLASITASFGSSSPVTGNNVDLSVYQQFNVQVTEVTARQTNNLLALQNFNVLVGSVTGSQGSRITSLESSDVANQTFHTQVANITASQNLTFATLQTFNTQVAGVTAAHLNRLNSIDAFNLADQNFNTQVAGVTASQLARINSADSFNATQQIFDTQLTSITASQSSSIVALQTFNSQVAGVTATQNATNTAQTNSINSLQTFNSQVAGVTATHLSRINSLDNFNAQEQIFNTQLVNITSSQGNLLQAHQVFNSQVANVTGSHASRLTAVETQNTAQTNSINALNTFNSQVGAVSGAVRVSQGSETYWKMYSGVYSVSGTANPQTLLDQSGVPFNTSRSYRVRGYCVGTGTDTGAEAIFTSFDSTNWIVRNVYQAGTNSNHVRFFVDSNVPKIGLWSHASLYSLVVLVEEIYGNSGGGMIPWAGMNIQDESGITYYRGHWYPAVADTYQLGNASNRWLNMYSKAANVDGDITMNAGRIILTGSTGGINGSTRYIGQAGTTTDLYLNAATSSGQIYFAVNETSQALVTSSGIVPPSDNSKNLGGSGNSWAVTYTHQVNIANSSLFVEGGRSTYITGDAAPHIYVSAGSAGDFANSPDFTSQGRNVIFQSRSNTERGFFFVGGYPTPYKLLSIRDDINVVTVPELTEVRIGRGQVRAGSDLHSFSTSATTPTSGKSVRIAYDTAGNLGDIVSYNWASASYEKLRLRGSSIEFIGSLVPFTDNAYTLGTQTNQLSNVWARTLRLAFNNTTYASIYHDGTNVNTNYHLVPSVDGSINLGTSSFRWLDLFLTNSPNVAGTLLPRVDRLAGTAAATGWRRIASCSSNSGRGYARVIIETTGGSFQPVQHIVHLYKSWGSGGGNDVGISVDSTIDLTFYWDEFRVVQEADNSTHLEINVTTINTALTITVIQEGNYRSWTPIAATATTGTGTVIGNCKTRRGAISFGGSTKGKATVGSWAPNAAYAYFGNAAIDQEGSSGNYALLQGTNGDTHLNSASGQSLSLKINNSNKLVFTSTQANFTSLVSADNGTGYGSYWFRVSHATGAAGAIVDQMIVEGRNTNVNGSNGNTYAGIVWGHSANNFNSYMTLQTYDGGASGLNTLKLEPAQSTLRGNFIPLSSATYNLGSSSNYWADLYIARVVDQGVTGSFTVGGVDTSYYPVRIRPGKRFVVTSGYDELCIFELFRDDVHQGGSNKGSFRAIITAQPSDWGHRPATNISMYYRTGFGSPYNDPIGDFTSAQYSPDIIVWLKGAGTYQWRALTQNTGGIIYDANTTGVAKTGTNGETWNIITSQQSWITTAKNTHWFHNGVTTGTFYATNAGDGLVLTDNGSNNYIKSAVNLILSADYSSSYSGQYSSIRFFTDGSEKMKLDYSGKLLVGGSLTDTVGLVQIESISGSDALTLKSTGGNSPYLRFNSGGGYRHLIWEVDGPSGYLAIDDVDGTPVRFGIHVQPITNGANDLGSSGLQWRDGYFSGSVAVGGLLTARNATAIGALTVRTVNETAPNSVSAWDNTKHTILAGPATNANSLALAASVDNSTNDVHLYSLTPGSAWNPFRIFSNSFHLHFASASSTYDFSTVGITPGSDNTRELGLASFRWKNVFVANQLNMTNLGAGGNPVAVQYNTSNSRGGIFIDATSGEPYFGSNITYSSGDTRTRATIPPWRMGNPGGSATQSWRVQYSAAGTAGSAITWSDAIIVNSTGTVNTISITPISNNTYDLGASGTAWRDSFVARDSFVSRDLVIGTGAGATGDTTGFLYITGCPGVPTGVPTTYTGRYAMRWDSTNDKLYIYDGSWVQAGGSSGLTGSLATTQIAFASAANTISGSNVFTFDDTNGLKITAGGFAVSSANFAQNGGNYNLDGTVTFLRRTLLSGGASTVILPTITSTNAGRLYIVGGYGAYNSSTSVNISAAGTDEIDQIASSVLRLTEDEATVLIADNSTLAKSWVTLNKPRHDETLRPDPLNFYRLGITTWGRYHQWFTDFIGTSVPNELTSAVLGTAAAVTIDNSIIPGPYNPGWAACATGTTTTGRAAVHSHLGGMVVNNHGVFQYEFSSTICVSALSDATNTYGIRIGFIDSVSADPTNGIYFRYLHTANSGNWVGVNKTGGVETTVNLDTGPVLSNAIYQNLKIYVTGKTTVTNIEFYINNVLKGSIASPTNAFLGFGASIIKTAGTTSRTLYIDFIGYRAVMPRTNTGSFGRF